MRTRIRCSRTRCLVTCTQAMSLRACTSNSNNSSSSSSSNRLCWLRAPRLHRRRRPRSSSSSSMCPRCRRPQAAAAAVCCLSMARPVHCAVLRVPYRPRPLCRRVCLRAALHLHRCTYSSSSSSSSDRMMCWMTSMNTICESKHMSFAGGRRVGLCVPFSIAIFFSRVGFVFPGISVSYFVRLW